MRDTSRFSATIIVGLLAGTGVAACSLAGGDIDHYNSGNRTPNDTTDRSDGGVKTDGAAADGGDA